MTDYIHDYPPCSYTHVWLRVLHEALDPDDVTQLLGLQPTRIVRVGDRVHEKSTRTRTNAVWLLESSDAVESRDSRAHFDWLLDRVGDKGPQLRALAARGYLVDICCKWDSAAGNGGPTFAPAQLSALGNLGIEVWFDIYFDKEAWDAS
ncbi:MAG: DUF4279 domain-containing protein [Lysobacter sp.]|nr:DUF4279 domain-containing protein [Lysobacter sp.]